MNSYTVTFTDQSNHTVTVLGVEAYNKITAAWLVLSSQITQANAAAQLVATDTLTITVTTP
jgi:hypothetical protein